METLSLPNNDKESMIAKYRSKVKEDETRNINNWNKDFDKLKKPHLEEQDSNEIDNFLKYAEKPTITQPQSTKILNLSNVPLTKDEIDILKLRQSFTQTAKQNRAELENDIFQLTRKLRFTYHYRNSNIADESIVKLESTYIPKPNENVNLENICKELKQTKTSLFKTKDNLHTSWKGLDSLIWKIDSNKKIIEPAVKGSVIVTMPPYYHWNICQPHISDVSYYRILNDTDPSNIVQQPVTQFPDKYKPMLTLKEYNYLTKRKHKISNLCMLPKLHKSKQIYEIIQKQQCEYINIEENTIVEARPIVASPVYHTSGISEILHIVMEPSLAMILHIAKDSFDFKNRLDKHCSNGTTLST